MLSDLYHRERVTKLTWLSSGKPAICSMSYRVGFRRRSCCADKKKSLSTSFLFGCGNTRSSSTSRKTSGTEMGTGYDNRHNSPLDRLLLCRPGAVSLTLYRLSFLKSSAPKVRYPPVSIRPRRSKFFITRRSPSRSMQSSAIYKNIVTVFCVRKVFILCF